MVNDQEIWSTVRTNLKEKNQNNKIFQTWFEQATFLGAEQEENGSRIFSLGVPTEFHKFWISNNLLEGIFSEFSNVFKGPFKINFVVTGQNYQNDTEDPNALRNAIESTPESLPVENTFPSQKNFDPAIRYLKPSYTFSSFVVGKNTEFAHAASFNVAQNPGADGYNPLFICGPVGMGKTHLLNAVGNHIKQIYPNYRVVYFSAQTFINECVAAIRRGEMDKFRNRYRDKCDIMLVDDIQFLRGNSSQEEFFHALDELLHRRCQIVAASDRMPKDIDGLEDRIRSRLEWGLVADIQMPDLETRIAILRYKSEQLNMRIPDNVVAYIAKTLKQSVRQLEGALNKVKMYSEFRGGLPITLELAQSVLDSHETPNVVTIEEIQKLVCSHYNIRIQDIKGQNRSKPLVLARQVAMYLVKNHLDKSLVDIGRAFGGRDHTTVINALDRIKSELTKNPELKNDISELTNRIHNLTGV